MSFKNKMDFEDFNSDVMRDIISEADAGMVIKIIENHPQWELPREVGKKT